MAGGTCTRHLGAGNAAFCSLNYGHMSLREESHPLPPRCRRGALLLSYEGGCWSCCARRGSNPHGLAATRLSTWGVYLFRHERRHWVLRLLPVDDSNVVLRGSEPGV